MRRYNVYRNQLTGAWMQSLRMPVLCNVRCLAFGHDYFLSGVPRRSLICIDEVGCVKNRYDRNRFEGVPSDDEAAMRSHGTKPGEKDPCHLRMPLPSDLTRRSFVRGSARVARPFTSALLAAGQLPISHDRQKGVVFSIRGRLAYQPITILCPCYQGSCRRVHHTRDGSLSPLRDIRNLAKPSSASGSFCDTSEPASARVMRLI